MYTTGYNLFVAASLRTLQYINWISQEANLVKTFDQPYTLHCHNLSTISLMHLNVFLLVRGNIPPSFDRFTDV